MHHLQVKELFQMPYAMETCPSMKKYKCFHTDSWRDPLNMYIIWTKIRAEPYSIRHQPESLKNWMDFPSKSHLFVTNMNKKDKQQIRESSVLQIRMKNEIA